MAITPTTPQKLQGLASKLNPSAILFGSYNVHSTLKKLGTEIRTLDGKTTIQTLKQLHHIEASIDKSSTTLKGQIARTISAFGRGILGQGFVSAHETIKKELAVLKSSTPADKITNTALKSQFAETWKTLAGPIPTNKDQDAFKNYSAIEKIFDEKTKLNPSEKLNILLFIEETLDKVSSKEQQQNKEVFTAILSHLRGDRSHRSGGNFDPKLVTLESLSNSIKNALNKEQAETFPAKIGSNLEKIITAKTNWPSHLSKASREDITKELDTILSQYKSSPKLSETPNSVSTVVQKSEAAASTVSVSPSSLPAQTPAQKSYVEFLQENNRATDPTSLANDNLHKILSTPGLSTKEGNKLVEDFKIVVSGYLSRTAGIGAVLPNLTDLENTKAFFELAKVGIKLRTSYFKARDKASFLSSHQKGTASDNISRILINPRIDFESKEKIYNYCKKALDLIQTEKGVSNDEKKEFWDKISDGIGKLSTEEQQIPENVRKIIKKVLGVDPGSWFL